MKKWVFFATFVLFIADLASAYLPYQVDPRTPIKILGLFSPDEEEISTAFEIAVRRVNKDTKLLPEDIVLEPIIHVVESYDSLTTGKLVCNATEEGIAAVFGPQSNENRNIVESMCQIFDIPHIEAFWDPNTYSIPFNAVHGVNVFPESHLISKGISDIIKDMDWDTFTIIYENHENLVYLQEVILNAIEDKEVVDKPGKPVVTVKQLPQDTHDFRPLLKEIKNSSESYILLDCSVDKIVPILKQAKEVNLMGDYQNYILTNLNAHTTDFEDFHPGYANITAVRIINPASPTIRNTMSGWHYEENERGRNLKVKAETVKIESALMYDAVYLYATALTALGEKSPLPEKLSCETPSSWKHGLGIGNLVKSISTEGMSGKIKLDSTTGRRNSFSMEFVEYVLGTWKVLGTWNTQFGLNHSRTVEQMDREKKEKIENRTLTVTTKIGEPYMKKSNSGELYGYSFDLIEAVAEELNFSYSFALERENKYGTKDPNTGKWDGLIRELQEQRADLAICDLTITSDRRSAVDFTMPFMTLGISILYSKPPKKQPDLFSFLEPLSFDVWVYMATAYLGVSLLLFFLARCTPYEWESQHPCDSDPEELENVLNLVNCLWFSLGSVLAQGCDILPKAVSTRLVAGMWWFFTLIMISSYTANLAAFLTNTRMFPPIKNVEDLAKSGRIKYGCLESGSTRNFFRNSNVSLYQRMHSSMESARPSVFVKSNKEGVDRVLKEKGKYAFFMESTGIEYEVERNCDLMQVGGLLDSKGYGIAMPLNSPHRSTVSGAVLRLQESGKLQKLKNKHWKQHNQTQCPEDEGKSDNPELGIENVGGVFVVLIAGCGVAFMFSLLEFLWNVRKVAVEEKLSPYEAFMLELKFAISCHGSAKPVRRKASDPSLKEANSFGNLDLFNNKLYMNNANNRNES